MLERKVFRIPELKMDTADGPGTFEGLGSTFGNVDEGGDVILKGAFADALPAFLERGFVPVSHDWMGLPIATIADVKETDDGLWFSAEFHSTTSAQDARTVMRERMERGKFVGLSIGYLPDYDDGVEYRDDGVRVLKKIKELAEISFVTVPMNREAGVSAVKGNLSFADEYDTALAAVDGFVSRARSLADLRVKEGRVLSSANRDRLATIRDAMRDASKSLDTILSETDTGKADNVLSLEVFRRREMLRDIDLLLASEGA